MLALAAILPEKRWADLQNLTSKGSSYEEAAGQMDLTHLESSKLEALRIAARACTAESMDDAMRAAYNAFAKRFETDVVWSGLDLNSATLLRGTFATAASIVGSARRDIIVAGYQVDPEILAQIGCLSAARRGVHLTILSNEIDLSDVHLQTLLASRSVSVIKAKPVREGIEKFHVKALVADAAIALVGSANFTYLGQRKNCELGVIVRGRPAGLVRNLLLEYAERLKGRK